MVGYIIADDYTRVYVQYYFNPTKEGFEAYPRSHWYASPWHPAVVINDSKKLAYINRLKAWTDEWYATVKAGFEGKLTGTPKPISPPAASPDTAIKPPPTGVDPSSVADRLKQLDALFKQDLISKQEYEQKRKEILKDL